jgi:hypothetical protein
MKSFLHRFLPRMGFVAASGAGSIPVSSTIRRLTIISPPQGMPTSIEWDLNDPVSMVKAQAVFGDLERDHRFFFTEDKPGQGSKRMNTPDLQEDMISIPIVSAG